jgi:hypothetical protein
VRSRDFDFDSGEHTCGRLIRNWVCHWPTAFDMLRILDPVIEGMAPWMVAWTLALRLIPCSWYTWLCNVSYLDDGIMREGDEHWSYAMRIIKMVVAICQPFIGAKCFSKKGVTPSDAWLMICEPFTMVSMLSNAFEVISTLTLWLKSRSNEKVSIAKTRWMMRILLSFEFQEWDPNRSNSLEDRKNT